MAVADDCKESLMNKTISSLALKNANNEVVGSMNMDEFVANLWNNVDENQLPPPPPQPPNNYPQPSAPASTAVAKQTADQVWLQIQKDQNPNNPLGEMSLEDFLVQAGVVHHQNLQLAFPAMQNNNSNCDVALAAHHSGSSSGQKNRRRIVDGPPAVVVERRQRRMIKNRESAARSRARKQAYTVELQIELDLLKEENAKLKQSVDEIEQKRKQEVLNKKIRTSMAEKRCFKWRTMRKTMSLAW